MKKVFFISLIFLVLFSCSKTKDYKSVDCSHPYWGELPVSCSGSICQSDTCKTYLAIWKELFMAKNNMTPDYFNNHITICNTAAYKYTDQGIQFELAYDYKVDWFETKFEEGFMIWLFPAYLKNNPTVILPDSVLLTKDQIGTNISNSFFSEPFHLIGSTDHLNYTSREEALLAMAHSAGVEKICESSLWIQYMDTEDPPRGHPMLTGYAVLNQAENRCVSGTMDLAADYLKTDEHACMIVFCFKRGTGIMQPDGLQKPIEKIKPGDKILSYNLKTMKTEDARVEQTDSVRHSDMVHITFGDGSVNDNTGDHPYYVKNKGWCSFKPSQTLQKYNLNANQLLPGDICLKFENKNLKEIKVESITENSGEVMTYNISRLSRNKSYFANGVLVSDEER